MAKINVDTVAEESQGKNFDDLLATSKKILRT
jgi:hypothetical protein